MLTPAEAARFRSELGRIRTWLDERRGPEDVRHLRKIERWGRAASLVGYGTAWIGVNPVAWVGIALGISCRWMIMAHHVLHGGYDRIPDVPERYRSRTFAAGWRRWIDWCDWMEPRAWQREHNGLHHHRLGEGEDPDVPERNFSLLARLPFPAPIKYAIFTLIGLLWKWGYYGPNVLVQARGEQRFDFLAPYVWNPFNPLARAVWLRSWLPYATVRFGLMPLPFLALGPAAWRFVLINTLAAELLTNLHSFLVIVSNHAGADIPRFDRPAGSADEQLLRQIVGSVNFTTGTDTIDFAHGWLNYQIEHHVWPDLTLRQYRLAQPALKTLCAELGIPYRQEPIWRRVVKLARNAVGHDRMPVLVGLTPLGE